MPASVRRGVVTVGCMEPTDPSYAAEKLSLTVHALADGKGRIQERLINAYVSQGMRMGAVNAEKFDPDLADDMRDFHERMTKVHSDNDMGYIHNTVMAMSEDEASEMASELVELMWRVEHFQEHRHPGRWS
jgi:hypothetical protein